MTLSLPESRIQNFYADDQLWQRLTVIGKERKITMQVLLEEAVERWLPPFEELETDENGMSLLPEIVPFYENDTATNKQRMVPVSAQTRDRLQQYQQAYDGAMRAYTATLPDLPHPVGCTLSEVICSCLWLHAGEAG